MLHPQLKEKPGFGYIVLLMLLALLSCKPDSSGHSKEEEIYLADYESPADKWGFMDTLGRLVIEPRYDEVGFFSDGIAAVNLEGRWGFIDHSGKMLVKPVYRSAWAFHEGLARVKPFEGHEFFIRLTGEPLASDEWSAADDFSGGLAKVKIGNSYGFININGSLVIPAVYSRCWSFIRSLAIVSSDEKLGVINTNGEEILPQQFDKIKISEEAGVVLCNTADSGYVYDLEGHERWSTDNAKVMESDGKLVTIQRDSLMFFLDLKDGQLLPGPGWSAIIYLGEKRWAAKNQYGFFLLNESGTKVIVKPYAQMNKYVDGIAVYYAGKDWGYMDISGKELTPDVFGLAWDFKDGFARAGFSDGIAFLNRNLELAFYPPPGTIDMRDFSEGLASVQISQN